MSLAKVRRIVLAAIFITLFPAASVEAAEFDYSDTSLPSIKSVSIAVKPLAKDLIEVSMEIYAKRKKNQIAAITFGFQSDLPYKTALEKPYDCAFISEISQANNSSGQIIDPKTGRPLSFISETIDGSDYIEHHKMSWTAKAPFGKMFCIAPIVLTDVRISLSSNRNIWFFDGRRTSISKKGVWYAYSEIWYNFPETNPCDKTKSNGNYYEGCGVGNASLATSPLLESDLNDAELKKVSALQEVQKKNDLIIENYERRKSDLFNKIDTYSKAFPAATQPLNSFKALTASAEKSWIENGKSIENVENLLKNIALFESQIADLISKQKPSVQNKVTITCVKGKNIKKVTAVKPICPAGYKKK